MRNDYACYLGTEADASLTCAKPLMPSAPMQPHHHNPSRILNDSHLQSVTPLPPTTSFKCVRIGVQLPKGRMRDRHAPNFQASFSVSGRIWAYLGVAPR